MMKTDKAITIYISTYHQNIVNKETKILKNSKTHELENLNKKLLIH